MSERTTKEIFVQPLFKLLGSRLAVFGNRELSQPENFDAILTWLNGA
jgi:hypothetical protein